jgi:hypothetical protein
MLEFLVRNKEVLALLATLLAGLFAVFKYWSDRRKERDTTQVALLAEAARLKRVCTDHLQYWESLDAARQLETPLFPFSSPVYTAQVEHIGRLTPALVTPLVEFYGYLGYLNALQAAKAEFERLGRAVAFDGQYRDALTKLTTTYYSNVSRANL